MHAPRTIFERGLLARQHGPKAFFIERSERTGGGPNGHELPIRFIPNSLGLKIRQDSFLRAVDRVRYVIAGMGLDPG
jgi:hypothetical protein